MMKLILKDDLKINRDRIDSIDKRLIQLLERRMKCSMNIGKIKKAEGLKAFDGKREEQIIANLTQQTKLDKGFVKEIYKLIFKQSKRLQK